MDGPQLKQMLVSPSRHAVPPATDSRRSLAAITKTGFRSVPSTALRTCVIGLPVWPSVTQYFKAGRGNRTREHHHLRHKPAPAEQLAAAERVVVAFQTFGKLRAPFVL